MGEKLKTRMFHWLKEKNSNELKVVIVQDADGTLKTTLFKEGE
ncbi:hypothetical protein EZS27_025398 [termite gut metagenome]|uniref:Uncharacterized protein n=1 Tax=termite gut metagenome TaxID=433724 RepID=A0A5J4QXF1_9ZZZZ